MSTEGNISVVFVGSDRNLFREGTAVRARMLALSSRFRSIHIIVFSLSRHGLKTQQIAPNVWIYPTDSFTKLDYIWDALQIAKHDLLVQGELIAEVVSAQDPFESGLAGWLIARRYRRKLQLQIHTNFFGPEFRKGFLNRIRLLIARYLIPKAQCLRVVSEQVKKELEKRYESTRGRIVVLPVYVDVNYYKKTQPSFDLHKKYPQFSFIVLMVSRLTEEKNIPFAFEVFAEIVKRYPRAGLVLVGSGPEESGLKKLALELNIASAVIFEGWQEDLVSYYKTANIFLHTSRYEGYGMVLVEAAACGLPIVSSDVGVAKTVAEALPGSGICPVGDKACFVSHVYDFVGNTERRLSLKLNADTEVSFAGVLIPTEEEYFSAYAQALQTCFALAEESHS